MRAINSASSERFAIAVKCSEDEVRHAFAALSEEGKVDMPLQKTFFSPCYGIVVDKYGVMWNLAAVA
jgi:PhnB protein